MSRPRLSLVSCAMLGLLPCLASCGWHAGLVGPRPGESVAVEVFSQRRDILERGLEPRLQDEVAAAVVELVRAPLVAPARADVILRGEIVDIRRRQGIRTTENQLAETGLLVSAHATLVDRRSGSVLATTPVRHVWSGYATGADAPENEAAARQRGLRHLARSLVLDLFQSAESGDTQRE